MNLSSWLPYDHKLDQESLREIISLIRSFLYIIPGISVILAVIDFSIGLTDIALVNLTVPVFCAISLIALNRGHINLSMIITVAILIISTTGICIIGYQIHEIGIILFPVIVLFSSLVMNVRGVVITTLSVILCLALIVFGGIENSVTDISPRAQWVDLIIALIVITLHIFATYRFSNITKNNLRRAKSELRVQKRYKNDIAENLEEKSELLRMVHHRVKNNLLLINSLIELETYGQSKAKEHLQEITESIHTIARAHDPLYHTKDYKRVSIKLYLEKLITSLSQTLGFIRVEIDITDRFISHEKALLLGIITQKILNTLKTPEDLEILIEMKNQEDDFTLTVRTMNEIKLVLEEASLIHLLTKELECDLFIEDTEVRIIFEAEEIGV